MRVLYREVEGLGDKLYSKPTRQVLGAIQINSEARNTIFSFATQITNLPQYRLVLTDQRGDFVTEATELMVAVLFPKYLWFPGASQEDAMIRFLFLKTRESCQRAGIATFSRGFWQVFQMKKNDHRRITV
ncbi:MAG: hypothetical protein ACD_13C00277G0002 [uncultured bacterium]|nr:MAG: hypothetical protein ACD_13C00277G0002 [uncultured bacterium]